MELQESMATQEKVELEDQAAKSAFGTERSLPMRELRILIFTREEQTDTNYLCTNNCVGDRTTALTLPDRQDATMSDYSSYLAETVY